MKPFLIRSLCIGCFLFVFDFCAAQPVITEYFEVNEIIKIDLADKKVQKIVYGKGILDITWRATNMMLAVTYDPKTAYSRDLFKAVREVIDLNKMPIANSKQRTNNSEKHTTD